MKATTSYTQKRITNKDSKTEHIKSYDEDNMYPQRVMDIINDSSTGKQCANIKQRFLMGGGFVDIDFYKSVINREGITADKLLRLVTTDFSRLPGFGLHVNYNGLGEITEVNFVHFEHCRIAMDENDDAKYRNKIAVYDDWGKQRKKKIEVEKIDFIDKFNPDKDVILAQVNALNEYDKNGNLVVDGWQKYKGQIYVHGMMDGEYPLAQCDAVLEDMQTQGRMKRFKFNSAGNNFLASHVVVTNKFEHEEDKLNFQDNLIDFQGAENTSGILHIEKENESDVVELKKVEIQNYDGLYEYTEKSCKEDIYQAFLIPSVLIMATAGKLGTSTEIKDATAYYNGITADERLVIEEVFKMIFSKFHKNINPTNDYSIIPFKAPVSDKDIDPTLFQYLTSNEIREANGFAPLEDASSNEQTLAEKFGVVGTTNIVALLSNAELSDAQKIGTMKVLFGLTDQQAIEMLGTKSITSI